MVGPGHAFAAGLEKDEPRDVRYDAHLFGEADENVRRNGAFFRVDPARQRLGAFDACPIGFEHRLKRDAERARSHRFAQVRFQLLLLDVAAIHFVFEAGDAAAQS